MKQLLKSVMVAAMAVGLNAVAAEATPAPAAAPGPSNAGPCEASGKKGPLSVEDATKLLQTFEHRTQAPGDVKALLDVQVNRAAAPTVSQQMLTLRRDGEDSFIVLLTSPKTEAGKGYLYREKNFWFYDPSVGRWERRTERDRIGGTNARRSDLAPRRDVENYTVTSAPDEKVEKTEARVLLLTAKPGADVPYAKMKYFLDKKSGNLIKGQGCSESGALMSTFLVPKWKALKLKDQKGETYAWSELHVYDEQSKGDATHLVVKSMDLSPLPRETFSKAWLESKSR